MFCDITKDFHIFPETTARYNCFINTADAIQDVSRAVTTIE